VLEPKLVLDAYRRGIFPMAVDKRGRIGWFSPDPRAVIPLDARFHIPHGLRRVLKRKKFEITSDRDFETVIRECARRREGTWIFPGILDSYCRLHRLGYAHSIETRLDGKLVGIMVSRERCFILTKDTLQNCAVSIPLSDGRQFQQAVTKFRRLK